MNKAEFVDYVENTEFDVIAEEQGLEEGEIFLPDEDGAEEFMLVPMGKYEMLIRDSEKLSAVTRYLYSEKPSIKTVKVLLEVQSEQPKD